MTAESIDEIAIEMAAEGCAETDAPVESTAWRRNARLAAAQLGRNDVVIRVRDGLLSACMRGWPRDAVERAVQTAALRRSAVKAWVDPMTVTARGRLQDVGERLHVRADIRRSRHLRVVPDAPRHDDDLSQV